MLINKGVLEKEGVIGEGLSYISELADIFRDHLSDALITFEKNIYSMTYDDVISIFKRHLKKLNQYGTDFDVWLSTAIEHVHDIFTILSPQHTSITHIKNDYEIARIRDKSNGLQNTYAYKAKQLIENFIEQLEEKKRLAILEATQKSKATVNREVNLSNQLTNLTANYNALFSEKQKIEEELNQIKNKPKVKKNLFKVTQGVYQINTSLFWGVILSLLGGFFAFGLYVGTTKFDKNLIDLSDSNQELKAEVANLQDTIKARNNSVEYMRRVSDSALNILGHMPYNEMNLDTLSFRKVQTTIENAGAALYLNKNYHY